MSGRNRPQERPGLAAPEGTGMSEEGTRHSRRDRTRPGQPPGTARRRPGTDPTETGHPGGGGETRGAGHGSGRGRNNPAETGHRPDVGRRPHRAGNRQGSGMAPREGSGQGPAGLHSRQPIPQSRARTRRVPVRPRRAGHGSVRDAAEPRTDPAGRLAEPAALQGPGGPAGIRNGPGGRREATPRPGSGRRREGSGWWGGRARSGPVPRCPRPFSPGPNPSPPPGGGGTGRPGSRRSPAERAAGASA